MNEHLTGSKASPPAAKACRMCKVRFTPEEKHEKWPGCCSARCFRKSERYRRGEIMRKIPARLLHSGEFTPEEAAMIRARLGTLVVDQIEAAHDAVMGVSGRVFTSPQATLFRTMLNKVLPDLPQDYIKPEDEGSTLNDLSDLSRDQLEAIARRMINNDRTVTVASPPGEKHVLRVVDDAELEDDDDGLDLKE